jgi:hypothetical protein
VTNNDYVNECKTYIVTGLKFVINNKFDAKLRQKICAFVEDAIKIYFGEIVNVYCVMVEHNVVNICAEDKLLFDWIDYKYGKAKNEKRLWNSY